MLVKTLLTYEEVFGKGHHLSPKEYLKRADKNTLFKVSALFLTFKDYSGDNIAFALSKILGPKNGWFGKLVYDKVHAIRENGEDRVFFNATCSLQLLEITYNLDYEEEIVTDDMLEVAIFKAYLALNSEFVKKQYPALHSTKEALNGTSLELPLKIFCGLYPDHDKLNYNIRDQYVAQLIKSIRLFQFLEVQDSTTKLLESFYSHSCVEGWQEFIKLFLPLAHTVLENQGKGYTMIDVLEDDPKFEQNCSFIESLMLHEFEVLSEYDFLTIRSKPILSLSRGKYLITYDLFLIEKLFKGMYFLLKDLNKKLPENDQCRGLRGVFTLGLSEKTFLYECLEELYSECKVRFSGEYLDKLGVVAAPDYYIRKGKNILLFESKDFLIKAGDKMSYNFKVYDEEFYSKLYEDYDIKKDKYSNKAVLQLISCVKRVLRKEFEFDSTYNYREVKIYPIIVLHDIQYDTPGLETWINSWFQEELDQLEKEGLYVQRVQPLSIINMDALLLNQEGFLGNLSLHKALDLYFKRKKNIEMKKDYNSFEEAKDAMLNKETPFTLFIDDYMRKQGLYKPPKVLQMVKEPLFG